jgi:GTP-binding protein
MFAGKKINVGSVSKKKSKSKKQTAGGKNSLHKQAITKASQRASVALPGVKSRAPPWQVLSAKDIKLNVEKERKRRERAREGLQPLEDDDEMEQSKSKTLLSDVNQALMKWKRFNPSSVPCGISFIGSYLDKRLPPRLGVPEVAFLGRSNVGKSSLLNRLSASALASGKYASDEARVGKTPGATASVNLYAMLGKARQNIHVTKPILGLVDLPGFGYAKLSKEVQESVQLAAERYLDRREELALGILLVDARREPNEDDRAVLAALYDIGVPLVVVATKADKLNKAQVDPSLDIIRQGLGLPDGQPLCVSSVTGEGTKELWTIILEACEARVEELRDKFGRANKKDKVEEEEYEMDEEGNPLLFEDGDDIAYDQGFDWVHDNPVMYDGDDKDYIYDDEEVEGEDYSYKDDDGEGIEEVSISDKNAFKLKNLKKRVRDMERRGDAI